LHGMNWVRSANFAGWKVPGDRRQRRLLIWDRISDQVRVGQPPASDYRIGCESRWQARSDGRF
jgi:hypothetical protein